MEAPLHFSEYRFMLMGLSHHLSLQKHVGVKMPSFSSWLLTLNSQLCNTELSEGTTIHCTVATLKGRWSLVLLFPCPPLCSSGSHIENWHSILRNGLVVASNTRLQVQFLNALTSPHYSSVLAFSKQSSCYVFTCRRGCFGV